jgi:hypothetical protein
MSIEVLSDIFISKINKKIINEDYGFLGCDIMRLVFEYCS